MKRRHVHATFAAATLACAVLAAWQGWRWQRAERVNAAIATASTTALAGVMLPEARFAQALAVGRQGRYDESLKLHKALIQDAAPALRAAALYNLGNLHLREALKSGPEPSQQALPLIELAKQSYRDALRITPDDWNARYNLDRALWLAPEVEEPPAEESRSAVPSERTISTSRAERKELP